jgi:DNA invertase Pin-like site-specific DNA recombinase
MVEVLSYVAEEERKATLARQAEGIAVWRRTGKTKTGRPYGRPRVRRPNNWEQVYEAWKGQHIRSKDAWKLLNVSKNIFYRLVHEYEEEMGKQAINA